MAIPGLQIIGERINPGFRSTRRLFETADLAGIQALALRQAQAGAACLNINTGADALERPDFLTAVIRAVQMVASLPLCFDSPDPRVQDICLRSYDPGRAGGCKPVINSITEARWQLPGAAGACPARVIVMASERLEVGAARQNRSGAEIHATARRCLARLLDEHGLVPDDVIIDVSISALAADTTGMTRAALEAVERIASDPQLAGVHLCGGLSNIAQQLPAGELRYELVNPETKEPIAVLDLAWPEGLQPGLSQPVTTRSGLPLREGLENAFLTQAIPRGLDMIIGTPWRDYRLLPADDPVYAAFSEIVALDGRDALRRLLQLQRS